MKVKKEIFFIKSGKACLPEIEGYSRVFTNRDFKCNVISYEEISLYDKPENVFWFFMGFYPHKTLQGIVIHDYRSLSTGNMHVIKDYIKCKLQPKPSLRIFLNNNIRNHLNFKDNIPSYIVDMGVDFPYSNVMNKKDILYDYVYVGVVSRNRGMDCFLNMFVKSSTGKKLLLVGCYEKSLYDIYNGQNIIFTDKVDRNQVYQYLMQSQTGISYIPRGMPYDLQTSTKMLEYAWCGLKILANNSPSNILTAKKIGFECNLSKKALLDLEIRNTKILDVQKNLSWENIFLASGIFEYFQTLN